MLTSISDDDSERVELSAGDVLFVLLVVIPSGDNSGATYDDDFVRKDCLSFTWISNDIMRFFHRLAPSVFFFV